MPPKSTTPRALSSRPDQVLSEPAFLDYDRVRAQASSLAAKARFTEAAAVLAEALPQFAEDYPIHLEYAYDLLRARSYEAAADAYRAALAITPDSRDAIRGLADAREGLSLDARNTVVPHVFGQAQLVRNNSARPSLWSLTAGLDARLADHFTVGADYRHLANLDAPTGASSTWSFAQDEAHLRLGYVTRRFGLSAYGAYARFPATTLNAGASATESDAMILAGVAAHGTAWATFSGALTVSHYSDADIAQIDLGAALPISRHLDLFVGGRAQAGSDLHGAARAELRLHLNGWVAAVGGEWGSERRQYDLDTHAIYDTNDLLLHGAHAYVFFPLGAHLDGFVGWAWEHDLQRASSSTSSTNSSTATEYDAQRVTLGLSAHF